ncbi:MAG: 50S ribosomal protein L23 [Enterobacteriaceae bacterium]
MNNNEKLMRTVICNYKSEKSTYQLEKNNTIIFKVNIFSNKKEIKEAIEKIFKVNVISINTIVVKSKIKKNMKNISRRKKWKKAYVKIDEKSKIDLLKISE